MNFKPLRATLVFLFALSATACSGGTGVMPITPGASGVVATTASNVVGTLPAAVPTLHANDICQAPLLAGHFQRNDSTCSGGTGSCPDGMGCGTSISFSGPPGMGPPPGWYHCMNGCNPAPPCDPYMCGPHVPNPRPILPPGLVGTVPPTPNQPCDGSEAHGIPVELGKTNLPGGTSGVPTSVVNIYSIQNAQLFTVSWVYKTENGNVFYEGNPNAVSQFTDWMSIVGGFTGAVMDFVDSPRQVTSDELARIEKSEHTSGFHEHHCFSGDLPSSFLS